MKGRTARSSRRKRDVKGAPAAPDPAIASHDRLDLPRTLGNRGMESLLADASASRGSLPPHVQSLLSAGGGQPLDHSTRGLMEERFGQDFSQVRVHTGDKAAGSAQAVNAVAYTVGPDIVFDDGEYTPSTATGRRLLAHELAHVMQQSRGGSAPPSLQPNNPLDHAADEAAAQAEAGTSTVAVAGASGVGLARQARTPLDLPVEGVEMPWIGKTTGYSSSELGFLRDKKFFWAEYLKTWGEQLSAANKKRVAAGYSPRVDNEWIKFHPEHAAYRGQGIVHHHAGQGARAVPLPSELHRAHSVFHPKREVLGTPDTPEAKTPTPVDPQRTQTSIEEHRSKIRGQGISPRTPPKAPKIPPASQLAALPPEELSPVSAGEASDIARVDPSSGRVVEQPDARSQRVKELVKRARARGRQRGFLELPFNLRPPTPGTPKTPGTPDAPPARSSTGGTKSRFKPNLTKIPPGAAKTLKAGGGILGGLLAGWAALTTYKQSREEGQGVAEAAAGTVAAVGAPLVASSVVGGPIDTAINLVNLGATLGGAPTEVTDVTSTVAAVTPSSFLSSTAQQTARLGVNLAQGDLDAVDRQVADMKAGRSGAALQGYALTTDIVADLAAGKDLETAVTGGEDTTGLQGSEETPIGRLGTALGQEAYLFVNRDLPEAKEFLEKDLEALGDWWDSL